MLPSASATGIAGNFENPSNKVAGYPRERANIPCKEKSE
jgi:hypothetical protein